MALGLKRLTVTRGSSCLSIILERGGYKGQLPRQGPRFPASPLCSVEPRDRFSQLECEKKRSVSLLGQGG